MGSGLGSTCTVCTKSSHVMSQSLRSSSARQGQRGPQGDPRGHRLGWWGKASLVFWGGWRGGLQAGHEGRAVCCNFAAPHCGFVLRPHRPEAGAASIPLLQLLQAPEDQPAPSTCWPLSQLFSSHFPASWQFSHTSPGSNTQERVQWATPLSWPGHRPGDWLPPLGHTSTLNLAAVGDGGQGSVAWHSADTA